MLYLEGMSLRTPLGIFVGTLLLLMRAWMTVLMPLR